MALVNRPTAAVKITFRDASGSNGSMLIHMPFDTSTTVALAAAVAIADTLPAISDAVVTGFSLSYEYREDAPGTPVAGSRVENRGKFSWLCANALETEFGVPAIKNSVLLPDGRIDTSNVAVVAMVDVVEAVDAIFCSVSGSDIVSLSGARQIFDHTRKRQAPPKL